MASEATCYSVGAYAYHLDDIDAFFAQDDPQHIEAILAQTTDASNLEDPLRLDESAGHTTQDPQSAGDTSLHCTIAALRQEVLYPAAGGGLAGPTTAGTTGAENLAEQHLWFGCLTQLDNSVGNPGPYTGSGSALLDFTNMQEINGDLTPLYHPGASLAVPEPVRDPYSARDTSCPSTATADTGSSSLDLEVNVGAGLSQSGGDGLTEAPVRGSCKRKKLVCGSSSQRSTPPEFNLVELQAGLVQMDPSSADIQPPTGSTDHEIVLFLRRERTSIPRGKEVNLSVAEQDGMAPKAVRSYVTTVKMMSDQKTHLGYWKEKQVKTLDADEFGSISLAWLFGGLKRTFQFQRYDGTKTNWFMDEYIPTDRWGVDLYMERLRFRKVYKGAEISDPGDPTSPEVTNKNKIAAAKRHRMRGPENLVIKGESSVWQHLVKIYDRHPELEGSKVVYAVCCHCEGVLKAGTKNGTNSLTTHCDRTCPVKNKNQQARSSKE